jgi:DNA modification methylase
MKTKQTEYLNFLKRKIKLAESYGFEPENVHPMLFQHQRDIVEWAIRGGRRAIFASFGLGKTFMQLEIAAQVVKKTGKPFLIGLPLGVKQEFDKDARKLGYSVTYVRDHAEVEKALAAGVTILSSNYERIREAKFEPSAFGGVSFDEASIIRGLDTETTEYILNHFTAIPYRFVCTATPSPNEYTEILNYAQFLGAMDRGQALTRFFQRDSTKAGNLTLYPHKEKEFWLWVSSWALFITKPSDLGYSDAGYDMPEMKVIYHNVSVKNRGDIVGRDGDYRLFRNAAASLQDASREKRESIPDRIEKAREILKAAPDDHFLIWHHLEAERAAIEKQMPTARTVFGSQKYEIREKHLIDFGDGQFQYLATKPEIAGSGCNFQYYCHKAIFMGIDYKFNDFIQAVHRIYRFQQDKPVEIHIIHTDSEEQIVKTLQAKWQRHNEMVKNMTQIIQTHGLSNTSIQSDLSRTIGVERKVANGQNYTAIHNDCVMELLTMKDDQLDLVVTSIPFSDQYEYCESYHDMGHNDGDGEFFEQLGFMTRELLRCTKPGRVACVHVKDRIQYSYVTGSGFTTLNDFSGKTVKHFTDNGWWLLGKITITTDVVQENNQTYRLGWSEQCKDGSKMGVGLPEYLLIFRKAPTDNSNAYADNPVTKSKNEYTRGRWQLDAHAYWKSNGQRLLDPKELRTMDVSTVVAGWQVLQELEVYNFDKHVEISELLDSVDKLSARFMTLPPKSKSPYVWDDVNRMNTLNTQQMHRKQEKHVCPLQFDIIDRCIERFSNPGELVFDPFGGIMSTPFRAVKLGRHGMATELNEQYWKDGCRYLREAEHHRNVPTLFDFINEPKNEG